MDLLVSAAIISRYESKGCGATALLHVMAHGCFIRKIKPETYTVIGVDGHQVDTCRYTPERAAIAFCLKRGLPLE